MARCKSLALLLLCGLTACSTLEKIQEPVVPPVTYKPVAYNALPGWQNDSIDEAWSAWLSSCDAMAKKKPEADLGPDPRWGKAANWQQKCAIAHQPNVNPRVFFEQNFTPVMVGAPNSLFTGYYEASLEGSLTQSGEYQTPVYGIPNDFAVADLGAFSDDLKGKSVKGRFDPKTHKFTPYPDRAGIEGKPLDAPILAWVKDPAALFFMHIQGSGRIALDDGRVLRIGYAEQNGHKYVPIGRVLKERGALTEVSMTTIREWMAANPAQSQALMNENPSYVFFRKLDNEDGPVGAQNVALTPKRSIAIDKSLYAYGMPFYITTENPMLQRLMIAQDTGGAIKGPVRADVFWGYGREAEAMAGPMQSKGAYWILLPNDVATALQ